LTGDESFETTVERKLRHHMIDRVLSSMRRNTKALLPLLPLIVLSVFISLVAISGQGGVSASQLFQSPVPPTEEPPLLPPPPTPERILPPTVAPPPPTNTPPPSPIELESPPTEPPQPAAEEPVEQPPPSPTQAPAEQAAQPEPPVNIVEEPVPPNPQEADPGGGELVIDSGLLIDSVLVYVSYAWLCCGVVAFIMIPVLFLALYVWGSQRAKNSE
jgi:hypothetical protein